MEKTKEKQDQNDVQEEQMVNLLDYIKNKQIQRELKEIEDILEEGYQQF